MSGWNRGVEQGKEKGFKAGLKGFFGEEVISTKQIKKSDLGIGDLKDRAVKEAADLSVLGDKSKAS
jgi:hypothetical protein